MTSIGSGGATAVRWPRWDRRIKIIGWALGGLLTALLLIYLTAHALANDTMPRNAEVNGVPIGGLTVEEAVQRLNDELGPADAAEIIITGQSGQRAIIDPVASGLSVDYAASVRLAGAGQSWDPRALIQVLTGGGDNAVRIQVNESQLAAQIQGLKADFARQPVDAQVDLIDGGAISRPMQLGTSLDAETTASAVLDAWRAAVRQPAAGRPTLQVPAELIITEPGITDAEAAEAVSQLAVSLAPIKIKTPGAEAEVSSAQIAQVSWVSISDGDLQVGHDFAALYQQATDVIAALTVVEPKDATVQMQNGRPTVVPAVDGQSISRESFVSGLESVVGNPAPREVNLLVEQVPAKFTTADATALGIREITGEFTTYFGDSSYHNTNLGLAAAGINNELVKPGEEFSLSRATGPRNASTGYIAGGVLVGDHIEMIVGGGVSQSATTTYNAAFFAGMTDVEHHPHTQFFSQYPPGREATVYEGVLDMRFRNDTPYGVLMEAFVVPSSPGERGSITVRVWSTRYYDSVTATDPVIGNYTSGADRVSTQPGCIPQSPSQGFDVNFQRVLARNGQTTVESYFWRYDPIDKIECKQPDPPPDGGQ